MASNYCTHCLALYPHLAPLDGRGERGTGRKTIPVPCLAYKGNIRKYKYLP